MYHLEQMKHFIEKKKNCSSMTFSIPKWIRRVIITNSVDIAL